MKKEAKKFIKNAAIVNMILLAVVFTIACIHCKTINPLNFDRLTIHISLICFFGFSEFLWICTLFLYHDFISEFSCGYEPPVI